MARAVHRVSVVVMPEGVEEVCDGEGLLAGLRGVGLAGAGRVVAGEGVRFYSSGLGGFRVDCPVDGRVVTAGFVRALEGWRRGGERGMGCGGCGGWHGLEELRFRPECGFARTAVVLPDVEDAVLTEEGWAVVRRVWGGWRVVVQRG